MLKCVFKSGDQPLILGNIIGLASKVFAELRDFVAGLILNHDAIGRRTWIAASSAVAMSDQVMLGRIFAGRVSTLRKKGFAAGAGVGHAEKFTASRFAV
jgi:hypothetical protein